MGKNPSNWHCTLGEMWSDAQWGNKNLKKQDKFDVFISPDEGLFERNM